MSQLNFVTGDSVIFKGIIPGCEDFLHPKLRIGSDQGLPKRGIVSKIFFHEELKTTLVDVIFDQPIPGVVITKGNTNDPFAVHPSEVQHVKRGRWA